MSADKGNSAMDGVPVKISEKYKRRPKIRLPTSCKNCTPGPAMSEQYDFRLEKSVLTKLGDWKKIRDKRTAEIEAKAEEWNKLEGEIERMNKLTLESVVSVNNSGKQPANTSDTLVTAKPKEPVATNGIITQNSYKTSEFETDNLSPYDNMELKTINEMEVLASVLSSTQTVQPLTMDTAPTNFYPTPKQNGAVWNAWNSYPAYSSPPQYYNPSVSHYLTGPYPPPVYPSQNLSHSQWMGTSYTPPLYSALANNTPVPAVVAGPSNTGVYPLQTTKSSSKSVPDLVMELEREIKEYKQYEQPKRKTKTPPPRSSLASGLEDWKPWPELESPRHSSDDVLALAVPPLARNISEMGFPVDRVVRSLEKFDNDDKKTIEFLLMVQRLEEKKFKGDLVERSLHANNYDEKEAEKHLEAATVLLDLGFDIASVEKALLESKNDRDMALDRLIS